MNSIAVLSLKHILADNNTSSICLESNEEVISRLKFIGHLQKDEKIDVRHVNKQPNTFTTKIYRALIYPDNRAKSLKFIKEVIARSFDLIDRYIIYNNFLGAKSLITDLLNARQGIMNLKYTYSEDVKFCCDMDVIIETIVSKLTGIQTTHPDLFTEELNSNPVVGS